MDGVLLGTVGAILGSLFTAGTVGAVFFFKFGKQSKVLDQCNNRLGPLETGFTSFKENVSKDYSALRESVARIESHGEEANRRLSRIEEFINHRPGGKSA